MALVAAVVFLPLTAAFTFAEASLQAVSRYKLKHLAARNIRFSKRLQQLLSEPKRLLAGLLLGKHFSYLVALFALFRFFLLFIALSFKAVFLFLIFQFLIVMVGLEIFPRTLALRNPERSALWVTPILTVYLKISAIPLWFFTKTVVLFSKLFRVSADNANRFLTTNDLKPALRAPKEDNLLEQEEQEVIHSIFEFSETIVREIMTPRSDTVCIERNQTVADAIAIALDKGHSRIPVYEETVDNIVGMIYAKDLLTTLGSPEKPLNDLLRDAIFIPETKNIEELFYQMKKSKFHIAIVVDEYGGLAGVVTLEDIIEELIGDIQDEYDTEEPPELLELAENHYSVDARMNLEDLAARLSCEFPKEEDYDTLGGFVLNLLGRFPTKGESITYENLRFVIKEISKRRLIRVEIWIETAAA